MTAAERAQTLDALKPYPAYKDSGVEWIGQVPTHWEVHRARKLFRQLSRPVEEGAEVVTCFRDGTVTLRKNRRLDGFTEALLEVGYQGVKARDLVIHAMDAFAGAIGVSDSDGKATPMYIVCCPEPQSQPNVYYHAFALREMARSKWITALSRGIRERSTDFRYAVFKNQLLPSPPLSEQASIAIFLDHETARIDALVREQELLLQDLAEKRQSTITTAVTIGIRPRIAQATDIPWMPLIPQSWRIVRLKHALHGIEQGWSPEGEAREATEDEWAVLKSGCVNRGVFRPEEHKALRADLAPRPELEVKEGDLLMSRASGSLDLIGSVALVGPVRPRLMLSDKLFRLLPRLPEVHPRFLYYAMNSAYMRMQVRLAVSGAEGLANNIGKGSINNFLLFLPPLDDQDNIIAHLDQRVAQIDELVLEVRANIEDMKLLRSTLITAATTGKIDVRDWRPA